MSETLVNGFITLFVVVDPVGLAPIFLVLTFGMTPAEKRRVAVEATMIALAVLIGAAIGGEWLLARLAIGLPAFRIAGGLLLFVIGFEMVFGARAERRESSGAVSAARADPAQHVAAFPLAIPLMAGPGAITASILLAGNTGGDPVTFVALLAIITVVTLSCALAFLAASWFERFVGQTGQIVFARLLGLILTALAVQIVLDGLAGLGLTAANGVP